MKTVATVSELRSFGITDIVMACGVFDGVHRGHQQIISTLMAMARRTGAVPVVLTFDPHPRAVLDPGCEPRYLTVRWQKLRMLWELGVEAAVILPFSREIAAMSPEQFLEVELLSPDVTVHGICVGTAWRFGRRGEGDTDFLQTAGAKHGFALEAVAERTWRGGPVSSTRIRECITHGRLAEAERMLGRPYRVSGHVVHGRGVGRTHLHCPTANLTDPMVLLPPCGVYAARSHLFTEETFDAPAQLRDGIVYIGTAPTYHTDATAAVAPTLELHLFDFDTDIYGTKVEVEFHEFIRGDRTFASEDALANQIQQDINQARRLLALR